MGSVVTRFAIGAALVVSLIVIYVHHLAAQRPTSLAMTRIYTGPDGQTLAEKLK